MLRIITDSASDITNHEAKRIGVDLVPLEISFGSEPFFQENASDFELFYKMLTEHDDLPKTSRPSPQQYLDIYSDAKANGEDVLVLCMSSGLSSTIESARIAQSMADYDRIRIVDTHQAILAQRILVEYAVHLRSLNNTMEDIADRIEGIRDDIVVCGLVDTLKYLKKGGRVPASLAVIGDALHIKPIIVLEDKILKTIGKAQGRRAGINMLYKRIESDGIDPEIPVYFGYTSSRELGTAFMLDTMDRFQLSQVHLYPVGGIIGTHCGTDCVAVAYIKKSSSYSKDFLAWKWEDKVNCCQ